MIRVVHMAEHPDAEYCGRGLDDLAPSPLANPFVIGVHGMRDGVIAKYGRWLDRRVAESAAHPAVQELYRLAELAHTGDLMLGCWCRRDGTQTPCHCDHIARHVAAIVRKWEEDE